MKFHHQRAIARLVALRKYLSAIAVGLMTAVCLLPGTVSASIITFDFTGRLTVLAPDNTIISNDGALQTPITASLTYDTDIGVTSSTLSVSMGDFWGTPAIIHDITTTSISGNYINAQMLGDWNNNYNMPVDIQWDATGLINAINYGLQVGDKLSGNDLYRDYNQDNVYDPSELLMTIGSAAPYSDSLIAGTGVQPQFYAPMAATVNTTGFQSGTPFQGVKLFLDIGSGNSMYVTSVSTVPVPAAVWLFSSGLLGLIGVARHRRAA